MIALPIKMEAEWEWLTRTIYDPSIFWVMVTAVATVLLFLATLALVLVGAIPLVKREGLNSRNNSEMNCSLRPRDGSYIEKLHKKLEARKAELDAKKVSG
jgi:hypothetical protein